MKVDGGESRRLATRTELTTSWRMAQKRAPVTWGVAGFAIALSFLMLGFPSAVAHGAPATSHPNTAPVCSPTLSQVVQNPAPAGSKVILHVSFVDTNVEDGGNVGFWALDTWYFTDTFWQEPNGTFFFHLNVVGIWTTFAGALSVGQGVTEPKNGSGLLLLAFSGQFTSTFVPGSRPTSGFIGVFNAGGTKSDILLGSYAAGQLGNNAWFNSDGGDIGPLYFVFPPTITAFETSQLYFLNVSPAMCAAGTLTTFAIVGDIVT
jgi:hypothetical protein